MDLELGRIASVRAVGDRVLVRCEAYEYIADRVEVRQINLTVDPVALLGQLPTE